MDLDDGEPCPDLHDDHRFVAPTTPRCASLPLLILAINAIHSACFQIEMLPLLHILNTRVKVPVQYLPAYGAIAFLPLSLRPLISFCSSKILHHSTICLPHNSADGDGQSKHERLLAPIFCFGILSMLGTNSIPANGILACFVWGFIRGIVIAWLDFLLGMVTIELAQSLSHNTASLSYDDAASFLTAQSRTALNVGTLVSTLLTFFYYLVLGDELNDHSVSFLLSATACLYGTAAVLAVWHQQTNVEASYSSPPSRVTVAQYLPLQVPAASATQSQRRQNQEPYECIAHTEFEEQQARKTTLDAAETCSSQPQLVDEGETARSSSNDFDALNIQRQRLCLDTGPVVSSPQQQALLESFTLVAFQLILATAALQRLIVSVVGIGVWIGLMALLLTLLGVILLFLGVYASNKPTVVSDGQLEREIPYYRLHLYFLLRNAVPSSTTVFYSFQYTVFASEPVFLQVLTLCGSAVGTLATLVYEKFLAKYTRRWPLIVLIGTLNVASGLVGLLDLAVIRSVVWDTTDSGKVMAKMTIPFRLFFAFAAIAKSFAGELDYLPTAVLSASNVRNSGEDVVLQSSVETRNIIDTIEETEFVVDDAVQVHHGSWNPSYDSGMQYASFLSSIDFGFQVAEWIAIPLMAWLHVTRESNWANLDTFVALCCLFQISRPLLLWLLRPKSYSLA
jgi:hypothetical protein